MVPSHRSSTLLLALALGACAPAATSAPDASNAGDTGAPRDGASMDSPVATPCTTDQSCSDGVFCNGAERCAPSAAGADARGCVHAPGAPCASGEQCNEAAQACRAGDAATSEAGCDTDGDGVSGPQCGGMDCDDNDPDRFPGNRERCGLPLLRNGMSPAAHDEDCNPCTLSGEFPDGDADGDHFVSGQCSNPFLSTVAPVGCDAQQTRIDGVANRVHGSDCDDAPSSADGGAGGGANVRPNQVEVCNGVDDNCNGEVDEGLVGGSCGTAFPGVCASGNTACVRGAFTCQPTVAPGSQPETCNGLDDDCDGTVDNGPLASGAACDTGRSGVCAAGTMQCAGGTVHCVPTATVSPVEIPCNGLDDDCDPATSDSSGAPCYSGPSGTRDVGACHGGTSSCSGMVGVCAGQVTPHPGGDVCDGVDDDCNGVVDDVTVPGSRPADTCAYPFPSSVSCQLCPTSGFLYRGTDACNATSCRLNHVCHVASITFVTDRSRTGSAGNYDFIWTSAQVFSGSYVVTVQNGGYDETMPHTYGVTVEQQVSGAWFPLGTTSFTTTPSGGHSPTFTFSGASMCAPVRFHIHGAFDCGYEACRTGNDGYDAWFIYMSPTSHDFPY